MATVLSISNISKKYGKIQALKSVSFQVPEGCVFGILGPNGSGKTTLLGIIMDVLRANAGSFAWFGKASSSVNRQSIGTLLETPNFYHYMSATQNLRIAARIKGHGEDQIDAVLKRVGLYERRDYAFNTYSLGMKQRLAIASSLLGDPPVLVFDEPTNGLDPNGIAEIRDLIKRLATEGKTIIMASHLLDEVEKVCTHVAILKKGTLLMAGAVNEVLLNEDIVELGAANMDELAAVLGYLGDIKSSIRTDRIFQVIFSEEVSAEAINRFCFEKGIVLNHLQIRKKSLESKFMEITSDIAQLN